MADLLEVEPPPHEIDYVVRRASGGLIDEENSVCFHNFLLHAGREITHRNSDND
jgi:hypothetical protein